MRRFLVVLAVVWSVLPALVGDESPKAGSAASSEAGRHDQVMSVARMASDGRTDDMLERVDAIRIRINAVQEGVIASIATACHRATSRSHHAERHEADAHVLRQKHLRRISPIMDRMIDAPA